MVLLDVNLFFHKRGFGNMSIFISIYDEQGDCGIPSCNVALLLQFWRIPF